MENGQTRRRPEGLDEFAESVHTYPLSLDLPDLAWEENVDPGETIERRRDLGIEGCALCASGQCVQIVTRHDDFLAPHILHTLGLS